MTIERRKVADGDFNGLWSIFLEVDNARDAGGSIVSSTCTAVFYVNQTGEEIQFGIRRATDFWVQEYLPPGVDEELRVEFSPNKQASMINCNTSHAVPALPH